MSDFGESLMQVTLSQQAAADLLFYLMKPMSMASAHMTMPSTARTFSSTGAGLMLDMEPEQRTRLKSAIETVISGARSRRSGAKGNTRSTKPERPCALQAAHKLEAHLSAEKGRGACPPQNEVALAEADWTVQYWTAGSSQSPMPDYHV